MSKFTTLGLFNDEINNISYNDRFYNSNALIDPKNIPNKVCNSNNNPAQNHNKTNSIESIRESEHLDDDENNIDDNSVGSFEKICSILWSFCPTVSPILWQLGLIFMYIYLIERFIHERSSTLELTYSVYLDQYKCVGIILGIDILVLLIVLLIRSTLLNTIFQILFPEGRFTIAFKSILDPDIFLLIWCCTMVIIWISQLKNSKESYNFSFFLAFKMNSLTRDIVVMSHNIMFILALRNLILNIIMFYFSAGFLLNMNPQVVNFLTFYSYIRKLNSIWSGLSSNFIRDSSIPVKQSLNPSQGINKLPQMLKSKAIERTKTCRIHNWLALQLIKQNPVTVMVNNTRHELLSKKDTHEFAKLLFWDIVHNTDNIISWNSEFIKFKRNEFSKNMSNINNLDCNLESVIVRDNPTCSDQFMGNSTTLPLNINEQSIYPNSPSMDNIYDITTNPNEITTASTNTIKTPQPYTPSIYASSISSLSSLLFADNNSNEEGAINTYRFNSENYLSPVSSNGIQSKEINCNMFLSSKIPKKQLHRYITKEVLEVLFPNDHEIFMKLFNIDGHEKITESAFIRGFVSTYEQRKKLISNIDGQRGITNVLRRMLSVFLWFFTIVITLIVIGVNINTIFISGAALLTTVAISLSHMYSSFFTSVIFIVFQNPYNIGDRIRINNDRAMYVRKIGTYCTVFSTLHDQPVTYPHTWLAEQAIYNEGRCHQATLEIVFRISSEASPFAIQNFKKEMETYVNNRPMEFVKDSLFFYCYSIQPGHYAEVAVWVTHVEPWSNSRPLWESRTKLNFFILNTLKKQGVNYMQPVLPISVGEKY
ncbi:mechanosensitive ion channel family protein [Cryptosporidium muris RN66]|uniref:Mechanosensitive ion channel family protein n=1 Tax=Cryptosporidium muris (strain RN66) TaxID=441375 RepID=B6AC59_CRYMR|nr:mechanosensitive ion channel family protein [Cryptosporidium muris RN66]EEA05412.1 mechanosensitive ion channel family protein [Cryptosporidium muris RN66]|eukprot:XP_002139761.1 mechanosensitive ion channel family protein [Cryptosporidium muris RN66]